ncbi:hypothetical protein [Nocardia sp. NPDC046763]|uniref:hypothetical protein n=1 Tax=Nocardia sp. NPDC046763 TaxID=3155256 RepID=UPI0033C82C48
MLSNRMLALVLLVDAALDTAQDAAVDARERRRIEAEELVRTQQRNEEQRRRRILTRSGRLAVTAVVTAFGAAAFWAMAAAFGDGIAHTVWFWAANVRTVTFGDFGSLWLFIAVTLLLAVAALTILAFRFPYPEGSELESPSARWGFALGIIVFVFQIGHSTGPGIWWLPSIFAVLGHAGYGIVRQLRQGL